MFTWKASVVSAAMNNPTQAQVPVRVRRDPLAVVAYVCVILATCGYGCQSVAHQISTAAERAAATPRPGKIDNSAYTNASAAHVTLTNLNLYPVKMCVKGVITPRGGGPIESVPVCTGEMRPHTTIVLEAPYHVGAVEKACSSEPDRLGLTHLDWSRCDFEMETVH